MEMARIKLATCRTRCICSLHWATCCFLFNFDNSTLYFVVAVSTAQSAGQLGPIKYSMPRWRSCQLGPTFQFLSRFYSKKVCTVEASNQRPCCTEFEAKTLCRLLVCVHPQERIWFMLPVYPHSLYWSSRNDNLGTTFQKELWIWF